MAHEAVSERNYWLDHCPVCGAFVAGGAEDMCRTCWEAGGIEAAIVEASAACDAEKARLDAGNTP